MEVAADAGLFYLDFAGAERFGRPNDGVIDRLVEILHVVRIESNFGSEEFRIEHGIFGPCGSVEPTEIAIRERCRIVGCGSGVGGLQGVRHSVFGGGDRSRGRHYRTTLAARLLRRWSLRSFRR